MQKPKGDNLKDWEAFLAQDTEFPDEIKTNEIIGGDFKELAIIQSKIGEYWIENII